MRLVFLDPIHWDYTIQTVYDRPLGGSQSALCYLAEALARRGHEVVLLNHTTRPGVQRGVSCMNLSSPPAVIRALSPDVCIVLNGVLAPDSVRKLIGENVLLFFWAQNGHDQPASQDLNNPAVCCGYDGFILVSRWQQAQYLSHFPIDPNKTIVQENAVAPCFEGMYTPGDCVRLAKASPPLLAYTSTPFRGLKLLLEVFPEIRARVPGTRLRVYSSMKVYQFSEEEDAQRHGPLYRTCHETDGVDYRGSIVQSQLAQELRSVCALAYPNTFAETSCIAVMEAMAAGCRIITTQLGALPETTAGFGELIAPGDGYEQRFRDATVAFLQKLNSESALEVEERLRRQVDYVNTRCTWAHRAEQWQAWLRERCPHAGKGTQREPLPTGAPGTSAATDLAQVVALHQAGNFREAETGYREILRTNDASADACHLLGVIALQEHRYSEAVERIRRAITLRPDVAMMHSNLGVALKSLGRPQEALVRYQQALVVQPNYAEGHYNLGLLLHQQGDGEGAAAAYRRAIHFKSDYAEANNGLGQVLRELGRLDEAAAALQQALRHRPDLAEAHINLGNVQREQQKPDKAVASYQEALRLKPGLAEPHNNLGCLLHDQTKFAEAAEHFRAALRLKPDYLEAHSNLGYVLLDLGARDEAVACFQRALQLKPDSPEAYDGAGRALRAQGKLEEAVAHYRRALELRPGYVDAQYNLGSALQAQGRMEEALACFEQVLRTAPNLHEAHFARAVVWLLQGKFERGWPEYEWRRRMPRFDPSCFSQPVWDGSPFPGKTILLHAEQGLGDTLQFIRYAPLVKERGGTVVVACQQSLLGILARTAGIDQLVPRVFPLPPFDVHVPLLSLPGIFGTTAETIPARVPYLFADEGLSRHWQERLHRLPGFKVGIVWQGSRTFLGDESRSIPLARFAPLGRVPGVRLFSLQKGAGVEQLSEVRDCMDICDWGNELDEAAGAFMDTAAVMKHLDLVITSDTSIAHLAGALGVPVWTVLSAVPDWRWQLHRADCPWYPTMRLFRQSRPGDWDEVFERIARALRELVKQGLSAHGDALTRALQVIQQRWPDARSASTDEPVFVLAAGWRSGSTLLQRMLLKNCLVWGEPYGRLGLIERMAAPLAFFWEEWPPEEFLSHHPHWTGNLAEKWTANMFPSPKHLMEAQADFFRSLLGQPARERGYKRWGLKEVRYGIEHAVYLRWLFPRARFLFLVRNPYDSWSSYRRLGASVIRFVPEPNINTPEPFARHWLELARGFCERYAEVGGMVLKYEDVIAPSFDPRTIEDYLGFELDLSARNLKVHSAPPNKVDAAEMVRLSQIVGEFAKSLGYVGHSQ